LISDFPDWVPVPNEIDTCEFLWKDKDAKITCERLSDVAIKLNINKHIAYIDGYVGKVKTIPDTGADGDKVMTVNRIDFYDGCLIDEETYLTVTPDDTTDPDTKYTMDLSKGAIVDGTVALSGESVALTGADYSLTINFTPVTELGASGMIQFNIPVWYSYYDIELG
jgi:hypothetical protein